MQEGGWEADVESSVVCPALLPRWWLATQPRHHMEALWAFLPRTGACWGLTSALLWGGRRSEAACIAEGTAAHLPSQAGGTAVKAAVIPSPPPDTAEMSRVWPGGWSPLQKKALHGFLFPKGRKGSRVWVCSHFRSFCPPWKVSLCSLSVRVDWKVHMQPRVVPF